MFQIKNKISRNNHVIAKDTSDLKFALTSLGYYDDTETGFSPYADDELFKSVQAFQEDKKLKIDGILNPNGETQNAISAELKKDKKAGNAFMDFKRNFDRMNEANTKGADKYFHCIANYEATERGWDGQIVAKSLSDAKEIKDKYWNKYKDGSEDQAANKFGREAAKSGGYHSAKAACHIYRPEGLDDKY